MSPMSPTDPHRTASGQPIASVHVCDFTSVIASTRWVRRASSGLAQVPGARFAKVTTCFGTRGSAGFSLYGLPEVRRVIAILVWEEESALEEFLNRCPLAHAWSECRWAWHTRATPLQSRGSFRGHSPLSDLPRCAPNESASNSGPIAALTLGRTSWQHNLTLGRISPAAKPFLQTDGLITAVSAGLPVHGNCTFTLWGHSRRCNASSTDSHPETTARRSARTNAGRC
jgi:hypothetical protein